MMNMKLINLISTFSYTQGSIIFTDMSWKINNKKNKKSEFLMEKLRFYTKK